MEKKQITEWIVFHFNRIQEIVNHKNQNDIGIEISYYFVELLEMIGKLKRFGEDHGDIMIKGCLQPLIKEYENVILKNYENSFSCEFPESIISIAKQISKNLSLFVKEDKDKYDKEMIDEIEEELFTLMIRLEKKINVLKEMKEYFPKATFTTAENHIQYGLDAFENIYFPTTSFLKEVKDYIEYNKVTKEEYPFFFRPTIDEIPLILPFETEEIIADVLSETDERKF